MRKIFGIISFTIAMSLQMEQAPAMDFVKEKLSSFEDHSASHNDTELVFGAALEGNVKILKKLIKRNKSNTDFLAIRNDRGHTPLHCAAVQGHLDAVKMLIQANPALLQKDLLYCTIDKFTPLDLAVYHGHLQILEVLVEANPALLQKEFVNNELQSTPLHFAVKGGHLEIVEKLIQLNPGLLQGDLLHDRMEYTPLHSAVHMHHFTIAVKLIDLKPELVIMKSWAGKPIDLSRTEAMRNMLQEAERRYLEKK